MFEDFQYVVVKPKPNPICFGSKTVRDTNQLSPFQKRYARENYPKISPLSYSFKTGLEELDQKVRSNKGVSGLASPTPRFPKTPRSSTPSPTRSTKRRRRQIKKVKRNKIPFGTTVPRSITVPSSTPGPGNYNIKYPCCARTKLLQYNFGQTKMLPAVEEKCRAVLEDKCDLCGIWCDYDYWHINYTQYLCNFCMQQQKIKQKYATLKELKKYQKIRTCTTRHRHEGTNGTVWLLPKSKQKKKERVENYLSQFLSNF